MHGCALAHRGQIWSSQWQQKVSLHWQGQLTWDLEGRGRLEQGHLGWGPDGNPGWGWEQPQKCRPDQKLSSTSLVPARPGQPYMGCSDLCQWFKKDIRGVCSILTYAIYNRGHLAWLFQHRLGFGYQYIIVGCLQMLFVNELFYHIIYRVVLLVIIAYSGFF